MKYLVALMMLIASTTAFADDQRDVQIVDLNVVENGNVVLEFQPLTNPDIVRYEFVFYPDIYPGWEMIMKADNKSKNGDIYKYIITNGYIQPYKYTMVKIVAYARSDVMVYESNIFIVYAKTGQTKIVKVQFPY